MLIAQPIQVRLYARHLEPAGFFTGRFCLWRPPGNGREQPRKEMKLKGLA